MCIWGSLCGHSLSKHLLATICPSICSMQSKHCKLIGVYDVDTVLIPMKYSKPGMLRNHHPPPRTSRSRMSRSWEIFPVPHKAVVEVSKIGHFFGEVERIHRWTDRWLELCFLEWLQWLQWSPYHSCWM